ncbi:hypothetical protein G6F16_008923 [Rhizopus arrhizus]|nr:hypothetical protein G6F21_010857 [Rhizopus arrhizus]KAG0806445.1 hypothetical protein G6F20_011119 [Rhizopus arrhizus]KAG0821928.1 hypothetical protein G6F19_011662 [Rhizopus arrhizus]KAG0823789.1 hypothetical protein G6F18_011145 [Rhizopus arrhizus]KAG0867230.1 hypothetical protein G6F16_008923 [Rhizopus arrhizus]
MGLQPRTAAFIGVGVAATACLGYMLYFDYQRRNNPVLKKKIKKEKKKAEKEVKKAQEKVKLNTIQIIESVIEAASEETLPSTPEEKEKYFMQQVALGEGLCNQGEAFYNDAVLPFYLALRVYPAPMELIMIYQKTVPEPVFQMIINAMALDQQKRQNQFYESFPPKETNTKLTELPAGTNEEGKPVVRRGLVVNRDIAADEVIYVEKPIVSGLFPGLEGFHCNLCLKRLNDVKVECPDCDVVAFCSDECLNHAKEEYHQYLCPQNKKEKNVDALEFHEALKKNNTKYPSMIARFLSAMVVEELSKSKEQQKVGEASFGAWDHVDRFRYLEISENEETVAEIEMLKKVLGPKVQGINEFLSKEIYLMLKGKLLFNAYAIPANFEDIEVEESKEHARKLDNSEAKHIGAALYKISTYIGQSEDDPNVKIEFENDTISVRALREIKEDEELVAAYSLPVSKK